MYVFDTNTLTAIFRHYYFDRFPSFWVGFDALVADGKLWSVREVRREIEQLGRADALEEWTGQNSGFFRVPTAAEATVVTKIYSVVHFQQNLDRKKLLKGGPFADPFLVASAMVAQATVVTQEKLRPNGVGIPNICAHFGVPYTDLEGFLTQEKWTF